MLKIAVLVSGRGSNLQAIIDAVEVGFLPVEIALVFSNISSAPALERARKRGIEALCLDPAPSESREDYDRRVVSALRERGVGLVCLAGYMRLLTPYFISEFRNRIINIHPALLPSFPGLHVQEKALRHGVKFSGCTVHFVDEGVDTGPVIIQAAVPVLDDDTAETLSERILRQEHRIYPAAIRLFAEGRLSIEGRRVIVKPPASSRWRDDLDRIAVINPPLD